MSWDQVGLVSGDLAQPVRRIHFAVDPTLAVIEEARALGADLLVTHHPLLLRGVHSVATTTAKGASVTSLVVDDIALYVAHTNADIASPGVCDALAAACGLVEVEPLATVEGRPMGRVGRLAGADRARGLRRPPVCRAAQAAGGIRVAGPAEAIVQRVAVVGGAGDDMFDDVRSCGADVYVTADLRHHPVAGGARGVPRGDAVPGRRRALGDRVRVAHQRRGAASQRACGCGGAGHYVGDSHFITAHRPVGVRGRGRGPRRYVLKADPSRQWRLLDLQAIDTRLDQIAHAKKTLPAAGAAEGPPDPERPARHDDLVRRPHRAERRAARGGQGRLRRAARA